MGKQMARDLSISDDARPFSGVYILIGLYDHRVVWTPELPPLGFQFPIVSPITSSMRLGPPSSSRSSELDQVPRMVVSKK